jgi:chromosomal replication initiation ATPase DnaA
MADAAQRDHADAVCRDEGTGAGQLALPFVREGRLRPESFVAAPSNTAARAWLDNGDWPEFRLWLWGAEGAGKTHLLTIWAQGRDAVMLDGATLSDADVESILRMPELQAVAVDDADRVADGRALLHLVNALRERAIPLLLAGRLPPARAVLDPPDLASRLRANASVAIGPADDRLLEALLLRLLAEREIVVSRPVLDWLHRNLPRSPAALVQAADRLDRAGLAAGRPITRALARDALGSLIAGE